MATTSQKVNYLISRKNRDEQFSWIIKFLDDNIERLSNEANKINEKDGKKYNSIKNKIDNYIIAKKEIVALKQTGTLTEQDNDFENQLKNSIKKIEKINNKHTSFTDTGYDVFGKILNILDRLFVTTKSSEKFDLQFFLSVKSREDDSSKLMANNLKMSKYF